MISFPNAKINLGLNIVSKRADGYHDIESCFLPIPWCDVLEIIETDTFEFSATGLTIPGDITTNLVVKAYDLLKRDFEIPPVHIHLHKVIPMGAGLGGGSADASFVLNLLNDKFDLEVSVDRLELYAKQLGADCPFFIQNKPKLVSGIGEVFQEVQLDLEGYHLVVIHPSIHVSTQTAFSEIKPNNPEISVEDIMKLDISKWKGLLKNDFEESVFKKHPEIKKIKEDLYLNGAVYASMTGTGSSVFALFETKQETDIKNHFSNYTFWESTL